MAERKEMERKLLSMREVQEVTGLSRQYIYNLMGKKQFPEPRRVGKKLVFLATEVDAWIDNLNATGEIPSSAHAAIGEEYDCLTDDREDDDDDEEEEYESVEYS